MLFIIGAVFFYSIKFTWKCVNNIIKTFFWTQPEEHLGMNVMLTTIVLTNEGF